MTDLYTYINPRNDKPSPLISQETYDIIIKNKEVGFHFDNLSGHLVVKRLGRFRVKRF